MFVLSRITCTFSILTVDSLGTSGVPSCATPGRIAARRRCRLTPTCWFLIGTQYDVTIATTTDRSVRVDISNAVLIGIVNKVWLIVRIHRQVNSETIQPQTILFVNIMYIHIYTLTRIRDTAMAIHHWC